MRERKYRAWCPVKEEFIYSDKVAGGMWRFFKLLEDRGIRHFEAEDYIGREDKNGNPIYAGDKIKFKYNRRFHTGTIGWGGHKFWIQGWGDNELYYTKEREIEIIGNIHESTELLNEPTDR